MRRPLAALPIDWNPDSGRACAPVELNGIEVGMWWGEVMTSLRERAVKQDAEPG